MRAVEQHALENGLVTVTDETEDHDGAHAGLGGALTDAEGADGEHCRRAFQYAEVLPCVKMPMAGWRGLGFLARRGLLPVCLQAPWSTRCLLGWSK